ncbi:MAG: hypothetical protein CMJ89_14420 [Planctomycetes bacterium]|jgi:tetratricopeptide (TPR) repeat protein|nr:hypothetical protein [Planctomycetota bacterium]
MSAETDRASSVERGPAPMRIGVLVLVVLSLGIYGRTCWFDFVNYDDPEYVTQNAVVLDGWTREGVRWAFTETRTGNWIPLTWLSHMLDIELFGLRAGAHHLVNALLHTLNTLLLFFALKALTRRSGPSLAVAVLFCLHPQRVESVAWISERKDLLAGAFFFGSLWFYAGFARHKSLPRLLFLALLMTLGLLSKSMLVTLPCVFVLLDAWPLGRFGSPAQGARPGWVLSLREKGLFFAVAVAFAFRTFFAQENEGAVSTLEGLSLLQRLANSGLAYFAYLEKTFWPFDLAVFYPHPVFLNENPLTALYLPGFAALFSIAAVTVLACRRFRRFPPLCVGWLWFVAMLVPVIGWVQVGEQAFADRYAYLPLIGIYIALVFQADLFLAAHPHRVRLASAALGVIAAALVLRTWDQTAHWRNSQTLFRHALAVTTDNYVAHNNFGLTLLEEGRIKEAGSHFERATELYPGYLQATYNLGLTLQHRRRFDEAIAAYRRVLARDRGHFLSMERIVECQKAKGER